MTRKPTALLITVMLLVLTAGSIVLVGDRNEATMAEAEEFQQLVGGLGFGPALEIDRAPEAFDPRLAARCADNLGPLPGTSVLCPYQACSIFAYPPLDRAP